MIILGTHCDDVVKVYSKHLEIYFMYKIIVYTNFWKSKKMSPFLSLATFSLMAPSTTAKNLQASVSL